VAAFAGVMLAASSLPIQPPMRAALRDSALASGGPPGTLAPLLLTGGPGYPNMV